MLMRKLSRSYSLGLFVAVICLPPLHAQTSASGPVDAKSTAANAAPVDRAPDGVMKTLFNLIHAGKYTEAQKLTSGLLAAYPDDPRLLKAELLLEKSLAADSAKGAPAIDPLASDSAVAKSAQSAPSTAATQLTGMDKVDYNALIELARQAQQTDDLSKQKMWLQEYLDRSSLFLQKHPDQMLLWQLRAASALSLDDTYAPFMGYEAGEKLLAMGAADSNDPNLQHLMAQLSLKGWLDREKVVEAQKNAGDSLLNGLGMKFARLPGTTILFSIWNTRVQDFQAFVNDTHYDATQGMQTWVEGREGSILNPFDFGTPGRFQKIGKSWLDPGWPQLPEDPVTGVSWNDAIAFCKWLTEKERHVGKIRSDQSYRLPTDAEWSMAVGLTGEPGDTPKNKSNKDKKLVVPTGNKLPNNYGIFDLDGKVWQFCEDWYDGKKELKVIRGGSTGMQRASHRDGLDPSDRRSGGTFRVVLANDMQNQRDIAQQ